MKQEKRFPVLLVVIVVVVLYSSVELPAFAACDGDFVIQAGDTWFVSPTGVDDTANIQCAFDEAVAAGAGNTVLLMAGTFHTSFIKVVGFDGFFKGAGKDATVITSLPSLPCAAGISTNRFPALFGFWEGNIRVSDLSFNITEFEPCDTWVLPSEGQVNHDLGAIVGITSGKLFDNSVDCVNPTPEFASSSFERVGFTGSTGTLLVGFGSPLAFNVRQAVVIAGGTNLQAFDPAKVDCFFRSIPLVGTHSITESTFTNVLRGVFALGIENSKLTAGGSPAGKNTFDLVLEPLRFQDASASTIEASYNEARNVPGGFGIFPIQGIQALLQGQASPLPSPSDFLISHNTIHATGFADGIGLLDFGSLFGQKTLNAVVSHNTIILDNTLFGGIVGIFAQDAVVSNNQITGTGVAGIYMGFFEDSVPGSVLGWMIQGNNVENVNATSPLFPPSAPILLGPGTSNCTVVGGNTKTNVLDFGINNIIVGANNMGNGGELGQALKDAMERKLEILQSVWR